MKKLSRITMFLLIVFLVFNLMTPAASLEVLSCKQIDEVFTNATAPDESRACSCFHEHVTAPKEETLENDRIWIGCNGQNLPVIFRTLNALNETFLSRLLIWDSLVNILPADMFTNVRPRELSITGSMLSVFRKGAFDKIGQRLKVLNLRENIIKTIDSSTFKELKSLETLDLSKNKIVHLSNNVFSSLNQLDKLLLDSNHLTSLEDGTFEGLINLKTLNLANNKLTTITKDTFKGLVNIENLNLVGNNLSNIDWSAFTHMKRLRILSIGSNKLTNVNLRGFDNLQHLFINNNAIESLENVILRDLPSLTTLSIDRNRIKVIGSDDFDGLGPSSRLSSFSMTDNLIETIDSRAFEPIHQITALSLQNNALVSLKRNGESFLRPLTKLKSLYLTKNQIQTIDNDDLTSLVELQDLSLDQNKLEKISKNAFQGLKLRKLFLNENQLTYLTKGSFDDFDIETLEVVDLSDNKWECVCGKEWIGSWLKSIGNANLPLGNLGCIETICPEDEKQPSQWLTGIAICLTVISIVCLSAIVYLLMQEGRRYWPFNPIAIGTDKEKLLAESLTFPNPTQLPDSVLAETLNLSHGRRQDTTGDKKKVRFSES